MNFLQLASRLKTKARVTGSDMTAVTGLAAGFARLVLFVNEAWTDKKKRRISAEQDQS